MHCAIPLCKLGQNDIYTYVAIMTAFNALVALAAIILSVKTRGKGITVAVPINVFFAWEVHAFCFFLTNSVFRMFFGYTSPTFLFTMWGTIVLAHILITLAVMLWLTYRQYCSS